MGEGHDSGSQVDSAQQQQRQHCFQSSLIPDWMATGRRDRQAKLQKKKKKKKKHRKRKGNKKNKTKQNKTTNFGGTGANFGYGTESSTTFFTFYTLMLQSRRSNSPTFVCLHHFFWVGVRIDGSHIGLSLGLYFLSLLVSLIFVMPSNIMETALYQRPILDTRL